jgi:hypothetical protein
MSAGLDRNEVADADPDTQVEDGQAQRDRYGGRGAGGHVPPEFEHADGGAGHGQSDGGEQEGRKPAILYRRLVGRVGVGRAELMVLRLHVTPSGEGFPDPPMSSSSLRSVIASRLPAGTWMLGCE